MNISNYILEKLRLNQNSKVANLRDLDQVNVRKVSDLIRYRKSSDQQRDMVKMEEYYQKGSKPDRLVKSIKDPPKLVRRWRIAVIYYDNWENCYDIFRQEIINRGILTDDELDAYILKHYNDIKQIGGNAYKDEIDRTAKYLDKYNVKY